jgi:hypothetical protein
MTLPAMRSAGVDLEAKALTVAASMTDLEPRRVMHSIAEAYRRLAERAELRKTDK